ncbi:MAG: hypothetical protein HOP25_01075 [Methylotenera sp.]|nr:hypothetical protein [Methylotenera sp.]
MKYHRKFRNMIKTSLLFFAFQVLGTTSSSAGTTMDLALLPHYITSDLMNEIRAGKLDINNPVPFGKSYQMTPLCGVIKGAIEWQTLEDVRELIGRGAGVNSLCNPLTPTSAPLDYYFQSTSLLGKTYVELESFLIAQGAIKRIDQVDSTQWDKDKTITKVQQDVVDKDIKDLAARAKADSEEAQQTVDAIERRKAAMDSLFSADTLMSVIKVVGVAAEGYAATKNVTNEVMREAEAKQKYESTVSESSNDSSGSSSSSSSSSSGSKSSKTSTSDIIPIKRYEYVTEGQYRAVRTNKEEGCAAAKNAQPNKVDIKRIISTGACTCKVEASNTYGTFYACVIPFKAEISTTNNPNPGVRTPSSGVSR